MLATMNKLNTIYVGIELYCTLKLMTRASPMNTADFAFNGIKFVRSTYLAPTALLTFDPELITLIKELEKANAKNNKQSIQH
jgi:hypothetical protein